MKNDKLVKIDGITIPISKIKHWYFRPHDIVPMRSEEETIKWMALETLKKGWEELNPDLILGLLSEDFTYGSYWVQEKLDIEGYKNYLPGKFKTILNSNSKPLLDIVVLYEGIFPTDFPYALRLVQGSVTCLLTVKFSGTRISSLYMTDPDIFTYEPTFRKGGILSTNGEPMCFHHKCAEVDRNRCMTKAELQAFVVDTVVELFKRAHASVIGISKNLHKGFPNITTKSGEDLFYHRLDVSSSEKTTTEVENEYTAIARAHSAMPLVMPISVFCVETNGEFHLCGGSFFFKIFESRLISI